MTTKKLTRLEQFQAFMRQLFEWTAWRYVGRSGCYGYWENHLTGRRTAKWVGNHGTTMLHRSWLCGAEWDHEHYPLEEKPQ